MRNTELRTKFHLGLIFESVILHGEFKFWEVAFT